MAALNEEMRGIADAFGEYIFRQFVEPRMRRTVQFFRAEVKAAATGGKITVKRPYDETTLALPYVSSAENLAVGDQCVVLVLGDMSNCIVAGDGMLSTL